MKQSRYQARDSVDGMLWLTCTTARQRPGRWGMPVHAAPAAMPGLQVAPCPRSSLAGSHFLLPDLRGSVMGLPRQDCFCGLL